MIVSWSWNACLVATCSTPASEQHAVGCELHVQSLMENEVPPSHASRSSRHSPSWRGYRCRRTRSPGPCSRTCAVGTRSPHPARRATQISWTASASLAGQPEAGPPGDDCSMRGLGVGYQSVVCTIVVSRIFRTRIKHRVGRNGVHCRGGQQAWASGTWYVHACLGFAGTDSCKRCAPNIQDAKSPGRDIGIIEFLGDARLRRDQHVTAAGADPQLVVAGPAHVLHPPRRGPARCDVTPLRRYIGSLGLEAKRWGPSYICDQSIGGIQPSCHRAGLRIDPTCHALLIGCMPWRARSSRWWPSQSKVAGGIQVDVNKQRHCSTGQLLREVTAIVCVVVVLIRHPG